MGEGEYEAESLVSRGRGSAAAFSTSFFRIRLVYGNGEERARERERGEVVVEGKEERGVVLGSLNANSSVKSAHLSGRSLPLDSSLSPATIFFALASNYFRRSITLMNRK